MARTADIRDFADTERNPGAGIRLATPRRAWARFMWACEGFGLARFEREAGHHFTGETVRGMKAEHLARKP
ncbi:MAG: hypothetical protein ACR2PM_08485 [Hyphomicrobiales bacterium]